jgi:hypothetical protein
MSVGIWCFMKLWLQSGSGLSADSGTAYGSLYEKSLESRLKAVVRPGTDFDIFGIGTTPFGKDRYHAAKHKVVTGVIESALRVEGKATMRWLCSTPSITVITNCASCSVFPSCSSRKARYTSPANWRRMSRSSVTTSKSKCRWRNWGGVMGWLGAWSWARVWTSPMTNSQRCTWTQRLM